MFGWAGLWFVVRGAMGAFSLGWTQGPRSEFSIADLRCMGRELVRCGAKLLLVKAGIKVGQWPLADID